MNPKPQTRYPGPSSKTPNQLRAIWAASKSAGMSEESLRDLVEAETGSRSISGLSKDGAGRVLNRLFSGPQKQKPKRYSDCDRRPGMATGAQLRKIEVMWKGRARSDDKAASLRTFLHNKFGASDLRFLKRSVASDVIVALEKMEVFT